MDFVVELLLAPSPKCMHVIGNEVLWQVRCPEESRASDANWVQKALKSCKITPTNMVFVPACGRYSNTKEVAKPLESILQLDILSSYQCYVATFTLQYSYSIYTISKNVMPLSNYSFRKTCPPSQTLRCSPCPSCSPPMSIGACFDGIDDSRLRSRQSCQRVNNACAKPFSSALPRM